MTKLNRFLQNSIVLLLFCFISTLAQNFSISKIEPPNWWVGMKYNKIQLMIYGNNISDLDVKSLSDHVKILSTKKTTNPDYLFVNILIDSVRPATVNPDAALQFSDGASDTVIHFPLLQRKSDRYTQQGFNQDDVIYLIFTDRFVNGSTANDSLENKYEEFPFGDLNGRHGGDINGILKYLDYFNFVGVTALWITPMLENNMWMSYHGYAATDLYIIDPRFGSNALYKTLVDSAHGKGLKIIMDHVSNHIGINHLWIKNPPSDDWFNGNPENHLPAHHDKVAFIDTHGDSLTYYKTEKGWFTNYMPDLNQSNPLVANYLIQNTIWWIEYLGIDGIREDTYSYSDQKYLSDWAKVILTEYPDFNIVGEIWKGDPAFLAKYQRNSIFPRKFDSNLPAVFDFALADAIRDFLAGKSGFRKIYETIAKDFVYSDPENLVTFIDNHDIDRALYVANDNVDKVKIGLTLIFTTRGIPQILYGTEIGMNGGSHHGKIRASFPLEFNNDTLHIEQKINTNDGRELFRFVRKILDLRKKYHALRSGKLIHYPPKENVYVYKKIMNGEKILIILNGNGDKTIDLKEIYSAKSIPNGFQDLFTKENLRVTDDKIEITKPVNIFLEKLR